MGFNNNMREVYDKNEREDNKTNKKYYIYDEEEKKPPHEIIKLVTNSFCLYKFNNQVHFVTFLCVCMGLFHCYFFLIHLFFLL